EQCRPLSVSVNARPNRRDVRFDAFGERALSLLLDQMRELIEEVGSVMRAGRGFGMILYAEDRQVVVLHSLHGAVVQIYMRHFYVGGQRAGIDCEPVILRRDRHLTAVQIFYGLVRAVMPKFQFVSRSAERESKNLMAETNPENRLLAHQLYHRLVRISQNCGISRTVGKKNAIRIEREHFFGSCGCWYNGDAKAFLPQKPQNIFFDSIIVGDDAKSHRGKAGRDSAVSGSD